MASRPVPSPDVDSAPYWDFLRQRRLVVQECSQCGSRRYPPAALCPRCHSWAFSWTPVGEGVLYTWTVIHHGMTAALKEQTPYVVGIAEFPGGVRIAGEVLEDPAELTSGMALTVDFHEIDAGFVIPVFRARGADALRQ